MTPSRAVLLSIFFLSGFAGLVYEITWIREFSFVLGNSVYTVSVVLASFMAGLGIGGWAAGRWGGRLRSPLLAYAVLEVGTGLAGLGLFYAFRVFIKDLGPIGVVTGSSILPFLQRFAISFGAMAVPTALMGATLPLLVRHLCRGREEAGTAVGSLYGINTLGAGVGCFTTGFFLIRLWGTESATQIAAGMNILAALLAFLLYRTATPGPEESVGPAPAGDPQGAEPYARGTAAYLLVAITVSGAACMAYELVYFRLLSHILGNRVFASSAMITVFLLGMGAGSAIMGKVIDRVRREVFIFSILEIVVGISALLVIIKFPSIIEFSRYLESVLKPETPWQFVRIRMFEAFLIMGIPALSFGAMFPCVIRYLSRRPAEAALNSEFPGTSAAERAGRAAAGAGEATGNVYAFNTAGCIVGSLAAGFAAIPLLGTMNTMVLTAAVSVLLGHRLLAPQWETAGRSRRQAAVLSGAVAVTAMLGLSRLIEYPWPRPGLKRIFSREEASALVTAYKGPLGFYMFGDDTELSFPIGPVTRGARVQQLQAVIPVLLHPDPKRVLVVGMGFGIASGTFLRYGAIESVETVELLEGVLLASPLFDRYNHGAWRHKKSRLIPGDGRYYLRHAREPYDIIASNVCNPDLPGSSSLYTREFFQLVREHLAPGGLFLLHVFGSEQAVVLKTLSEVFPHVRGYKAYSHSMHLVASLERVRPDARAAAAKLRAWPEFREEASHCYINSLASLEKQLALSEEAFQSAVDDPDIPIHTDAHPILEYRLASASGDPFHSRLSSNTPPAARTAVVSLVGDILLYDKSNAATLAKVATDNPGDPGAVQRHAFSRVRSQLPGVVIGHLDGPLSDLPPVPLKGRTWGTEHAQPAAFVDALKEGGFNIVSLANEHMLDCGVAGLSDTMVNLRRANIAYAGAGEDSREARQPASVEENGIRLGFLAYSLVAPRSIWAGPDTPGTAHANFTGMVSDVRTARREFDAVVVSLHWDREDPTLARALVDAGAAIVAGSHLRDPGRVERRRRGVIIYNLGNFGSGGDKDEIPRRGMVVRVVLNGAGEVVRTTVIPLNTSPMEAKYAPFPLWGRARRELAKMGAAAPPPSSTTAD